ncbi:MAG: DNA-directed RNA polymerase subunit beta' [bacterium]
MRTHTNFTGLRLRIASPEDILHWSYGEVIKPETINYRTQRPEKDGLFSERIFGPTKDWECYCGKYRKIRYKGTICDKCGVEVTRSSVRRERMGHISLAVPVVHPWFLRSVPSRIGLALDEMISKIERVTYYAAYIVTSVDDGKRQLAVEEIDRELSMRAKMAPKDDKTLDELESAAILAKETLKNLRPGKALEENEFENIGKRFANVFTVGSGGEGIRKVLENIDMAQRIKNIEEDLKTVKDANTTKKLLKQLKFFRSMIANKMRPEWMIISILPILPPDLRPMVALDGGRFATSDLNDLYRRVINRNNRLKKLLELNAPDVIVTNEKRMLQEAVDALIDNSSRATTKQTAGQSRRPLKSLADMLKGKQGRFRQNLLGKRVDYSGRSVIVIGPHLRLDQCGLPKRMALELFRPFVIREIMKRGLAHSIRNSNRLIDQSPSEVWEILEEVIQGKRVLLNRAPTLHRLNIQAFKPTLIEDLAIQIPPFVCTAFNADFDGDQMAVHLPLSDEAQKEAETLMASNVNLLKPASGEAIAYPTQDMVLGCYYLTKVDSEGKGTGKIFVDGNEVELAYENGYVAVNSLIRVGQEETTYGRILFNSALPEGLAHVSERMTKKKITRLVGKCIDKYGVKKTAEVLDNIKSLGFKYAGYSGISWGMGDLKIPKEKGAIIKQTQERVKLVEEQYNEGLLTIIERKARIVEAWHRAVKEITEVVPKALDEKNSVFMMVDSGARGSWLPVRQMVGIKGVVTNPKGEDIELPIISSLKEGHTGLEYFISTHGSRKGMTDIALKTAEAGYLTRRLVDVAQDVVIAEDDCKTRIGITLYKIDGEEYGYSFAERIFSRTALKDIIVGKKVLVKAGDIITMDVAEEIQELNITEVEVRSPIVCKTLYGICSKCYGLDLGRNEPIKIGEAVGIVAAQSIGEPGTQLVMRTRHAGGVSGRDITSGLPRVEELFEIRPPKGKGILATITGIVSQIEKKGLMRVIHVRSTKGGKDCIVEYPVVGGNEIIVKIGDTVQQGERLTEGSFDLRELFKLQGKEATYRYLIKEIQRIYVSEGSPVSNKHMEVIVRQMFGRVMIAKGGDTLLTPGDIIDKSRFLEVNRTAKEEGKEPAKAEELLLGITRSALAADGWLAPASFQETARVLIKAATEGRVDQLRGLKENVIIGRLLPIGPSLRKKVGLERNDEEGSE